MKNDYLTNAIQPTIGGRLKRGAWRWLRSFVMLYTLLCVVALTAFYTLYFRAALLFGQFPSYNHPDPAVLGFTRDSSAHMRFVDGSANLLIYLFPAYVLAHALAVLCRSIRLKTSVVVLSILLFLIFSIFLSPIGEWYAD